MASWEASSINIIDCTICLDGIHQFYILPQPVLEQDRLTCLEPEVLNTVNSSTERTPQDLAQQYFSSFEFCNSEAPTVAQVFN
jgi:hypothetical protein